MQCINIDICYFSVFLKDLENCKETPALVGKCIVDRVSVISIDSLKLYYWVLQINGHILKPYDDIVYALSGYDITYTSVECALRIHY